MSDRTIRIMVAEDDPLLCRLLAEILGAEPDLEVVGAVKSGLEVLPAVQELTPQVLLLDLRLPGRDGREILQRLGDIEDAPHVLVLSGDEAEDVQVEVAKYGARGFQSKHEVVRLLPKAVRAVAAGEVWFRNHLLGRALKDFAAAAHTARKQQRPLAKLSERERDVLACIARGRTNQQIAAELFMSVSTVKVHIQQIFQKLDLPNRTEAAVFAVREGLLEQ